MLTLFEPNLAVPRLTRMSPQGSSARQRGHPMSIIRIRAVFAAALMIAAFGAFSPAQAAGNGPACSLTLARYDMAIRQLEASSAKAQAMAEQNPIYESDVAYYALVLAQAQQCQKSLSPVTTVSR
jgi:hypothetical protein